MGDGTRADRQKVMDGCSRQHRDHNQPWGAACMDGVPMQLCLCPAQEDTMRWQAPAVTQRVRFISLRSLALFFPSLIHLPH